MVTKWFNYREVFGNHFCYRHKFDNNINHRHYPISVERIWEISYWPDRCHAYFLAPTEVNANDLWGHLVDGSEMYPQLDFWRQLGWEMFENNLDEE